MSFFDITAVSGSDAARPPQPARPAWLKPDDALPGIAAVDAVLVHTDAVAIGLSGLWCYPTGFEFGLEVALRSPDRRRYPWHARLHHVVEPGEPVPPEMLRIGLRFADGAKVTNLPDPGHRRLDAPDRPILLPGSGSGSERGYSSRYWVWPLPPPGPLTFVCEWPHFNIGESSTTIDAQVVFDAAARARVLWPHD